MKSLRVKQSFTSTTLRVAVSVNSSEDTPRIEVEEELEECRAMHDVTQHLEVLRYEESLKSWQENVVRGQAGERPIKPEEKRFRSKRVKADILAV